MHNFGRRQPDGPAFWWTAAPATMVIWNKWDNGMMCKWKTINRGVPNLHSFFRE
jgi:hypothetical protein